MSESTTEENFTKGFTKPALTRLARRAGVKSMSEDCVETLRNVMYLKLTELLTTMEIVNRQNNTKTMMPQDFFGATEFMGKNVARNEDYVI